MSLQTAPTIGVSPSARGPGSGPLPPVVILGGEANALSVARCLGRRGIVVHVLNRPGAEVRFSRYCHTVYAPDPGRDPEEAWAEFLLGPRAEPLHGAVLLACSDAALRLLATHRGTLAERFLLDAMDPVAQMDMLDKLRTYEHARAAGVPTPRFWPVDSREELLSRCHELVFPLLVKPRLSHVFEARTGLKYRRVEDFDGLLEAFDAVRATGSDAVLVEYIPGPDDRLCSYYTYLDEAGRPLLHFTKRVIRRYPVGMGGGCYHVTDRNPEVAALANALFRGGGLRGLANAEFKRDDRDGGLKLIECNARFTAANSLVAASGLDLAGFVYDRILGRLPQPVDSYASELRLWDPVRDLAAFLQMRASGQITTRQWLASICHSHTFPYFSWTDPIPSLARICNIVRKAVSQRVA